MSEKHQNFLRLASARTSKAIEEIRKLRHLGNPANYEYTPDEWNRIFMALKNEIDQLREVVTTPQKPKRVLSFQLQIENKSEARSNGAES